MERNECLFRNKTVENVKKKSNSLFIKILEAPDTAVSIQNKECDKIIHAFKTPHAVTHKVITLLRSLVFDHVLHICHLSPAYISLI